MPTQLLSCRYSNITSKAFHKPVFLFIFTLLFAVFNLQAQEDHPARGANMTSAGSREDVSVWAGKMIEETNRARLAIKDGDEQAAGRHVDRATAALRQVEARAKGSTFVPLYQEFVSVSILTPVQAEHEAHNRAHLAGTGKKSIGNTPAVVHEVSGIYTNVMVSTAVAKDSLAAARQALALHDMQDADAALADVQEGIKIESTKGDIPLAEVRENLILARAAVRNHNYQEAEAALKKAADAFNGVIEANDPHADEARNLQQQINNYAQNLPRNHVDAVAKINAWWNETANWSPYKSQQELKGRY
jgi:flagellin-specific chaperone FliS